MTRLGAGVIFLFVLFSQSGRELLTRNRFSLDSLRVAESGEVEEKIRVMGILERKAVTHCAYYWQAGRLGQLSGVLTNYTNIAFAELLKCSGDYFHLVYVTNPTNRELAEMAVDLAPMSADAIFWLAEIVETEDRMAAMNLYKNTTVLDPTNGLAWCRLGRLLRDGGNLEGALFALEQCCWNGDPGYHGCWGAGGVNEQLGNYSAAIEMYRLSGFAPAKSRADELENRLEP